MAFSHSTNTEQNANLISIDAALINTNKHLQAFKDIANKYPAADNAKSAGIIQLQYLASTLEKFKNGQQVDFNQCVSLTYKDYDFTAHKYIEITAKTHCAKIAAQYCEAVVMQFLFQHGVVAENELLEVATKAGHADMEERVEVLVKNGVDVNYHERNGHTPLYNAALDQRGDLSRIYEKYGAHMTFGESVKYPIKAGLRATKDAVSDALGDIIMPFPR